MRRTLHPDTHPLTAEYQDNILRHAREVRETLAFQIHDDNPDAPKQAPEATTKRPLLIIAVKTTTKFYRRDAAGAEKISTRRERRGFAEDAERSDQRQA